MPVCCYIFSPRIQSGLEMSLGEEIADKVMDIFTFDIHTRMVTGMRSNGTGRR